MLPKNASIRLWIHAVNIHLVHNIHIEAQRVESRKTIHMKIKYMQMSISPATEIIGSANAQNIWLLFDIRSFPAFENNF